ncbi:MAG: LptF/LptG family permease [Planctomycetota bacterium]
MKRLPPAIADSCAKMSKYLPVRTLDRYVMKQFLISYVICATSIIGLFVVLDGLSKLNKFLKQDANVIWVILQYFMATLPVYFSQYLAPVLTLIAAMFAVTLLNKGQEIVPMKASGISIPRILSPLFLMALCFATVQIGMQELVLPNCKDFIREGTSHGKKKGTIRPDLVVDSARNLRIKVQQYDPQEKRGTYAEVIELYARDSAGGAQPIKSMYHAFDMKWLPEQEAWELRNGKLNRWEPDGRPVVFQVPDEGGDAAGAFAQDFERVVLETRIRPIDFEASDREVPFLSYGELLGQYRRYPHRRHLEVKLHQRFAFPMANLILLLLGLPFVIRQGNKSAIVGVLVAIGIAAAYMLSTTVCADLGNKGELPPAVAAWLPVLFFGALGFTIFDGMES